MKYLRKFENHAAYEAAESGLILSNVSLCAQENEVHYNPYVDPYNGHAYVDLGLPSGTKWATMNVGASSETDYGLYFAWGETDGYADASTKAFSWSDYKYGDGSTFTKYNSTDGKTVLDLEDDAVAANWGGSWKIPTDAQFQELLNTTYVTNTWVTDYQGSGVNGRLFTSVTNGNTLFIPAAGRAGNGSMYYIDTRGVVWSSSLYSSDVKYGNYSHFYNSGVYIDYSGRCNGQSVRGVVG